jgi:hypothetical protein
MHGQRSPPTPKGGERTGRKVFSLFFDLKISLFKDFLNADAADFGG